ncbi:MAG: prepilin-type N-terminal cleavage/methylation domain-containing protein [Acidimicrobiales bacterium]
MSDAGFSLVEVIVAVVLITITSLPTALILINSNRTASYSRLQSEADDVASQVLEQQEQLAQGETYTPPSGTTYNYVTIGQVVFKSALTVYVNNAVTGVSPCLEPAGSGESQEIWFVTVKVTWTGEGGGNSTGGFQYSGGPVSLTTELAPAASGSGNLTISGGEIAVPVENLNTTLDTSDVVWFTATGIWTNSAVSQPAVPSGEYTTETESTGNLGCAQFLNLDAAAGWEYEVTVAYCAAPGSIAGSCTSSSPEIVDYDENGAQFSTADPGAPGIPTEQGITVTQGQVTVINPFYLAEAATVPITFATYRYPTGAAAPTKESPAWEPAYVRVGVQNQHLQCSSVTSTCELGDATATYATSTGGDLYLYPYTDGYTPVYAGDETESNPLALSAVATPVSYYFTGSFTQPTAPATGPPIPQSTPSVADATEAAIVVQLYYAQLTVSCTSLTAGQTVTGLTFTEVDGASASYTDTASCTKTTAASLTVGLPLGEYVLSPAASSAGSPTVSASGAGYVWVTPFGVCSSNAYIAQTVAPITNCSGSGLSWTTGSVSVSIA